MSPAFWVAWIELIYSGEIHFGAVAPTSLHIINNYTISTTALGIMLVIYGCFPKKIEQLLTHTWVVPLAGLLAGAVTWWSLVAPGVVPTLLTGIFTSVLVVRFSIVFAHVNPKASLISIILSQMVASFVYGYVLALPFRWKPLFLCLLPFISACCAMFGGFSLSKDDLQSDTSITSGFVRFVIAIVLFSIAINVVRGYFPLTVEADAFSTARSNSSVLFFFVKMLLVGFVVMLPLKANLGKLCYYGFVVLAICTLPLPISGLQNASTLETFGCINAMLNIVVWSLFAGVSYKSGRSAVRLTGWGWGFMSLGSVAGWLLGCLIYNIGLGVEYMAGLEILLIAVMLLSCVFIVTWQVVDAMFDPFDKDADTPIDRSLAEREEPLPLAAGGAPGASRTSGASEASGVDGTSSVGGTSGASGAPAVPAVAHACETCELCSKTAPAAQGAQDGQGVRAGQGVLAGQAAQAAPAAQSTLRANRESGEGTPRSTAQPPAQPPVQPAALASNEPGQAPLSNQSAQAAAPEQAGHAVGRWKRAAFELAEEKNLSRREEEVLQLLLKGHSKQRVAEELFVSYNTVRSHVRKVYVKCNVHSQQELINLFETEYRNKQE